MRNIEIYLSYFKSLIYRKFVVCNRNSEIFMCRLQRKEEKKWFLLCRWDISKNYHLYIIALTRRQFAIIIAFTMFHEIRVGINNHHKISIYIQLWSFRVKFHMFFVFSFFTCYFKIAQFINSLLINLSFINNNLMWLFIICKDTIFLLSLN